MNKAHFSTYVKKLLKYSATTLVGTATDTLVLWVFSHFIFHTYTLRYVVSPIISFECAVLVNFLFAYFFVWKSRITTRNVHSFFKHYLPFNLSASGIFIVKLGLLLVIERLTGWIPILCNIIALTITGFGNFAVNEFVIFKVKNSNADSKAGIVEELENSDIDSPLSATAAKAAAAKAAASAEGGETSVASDR